MRDDYLAKIDKIPDSSYNKEQKQLAKEILKTVPEKDLDEVYGFITQRVKTGFVFDEAPEVNHNCVVTVKENTKLNIAVNELNRLEHKLIIGENYDALKNLCAAYIDKNGKGLIDIIYIDPPYNTESTQKDGNDYKEEVKASKFVYRDKFTRDGWLNLMNERLKMARRLLSDNGVIFISIDDSEQAYLKVLCDTIFGENNFVGNLIWLKKNAQNDANNLQSNHEYIVIYAKSKTKKLLSQELLKDVKVLEENGDYFYEGAGLTTGGAGGTLNNRPNLGYTIYYNPENKDKIAVADYNIAAAKTSNEEEQVYCDDINLINNGYIKIRPPKKAGKLGCWTWSIDKFNNEKSNIYIKRITNGYSVCKKGFVDKHTMQILKSKPLNSYVEIPSSNGTKILLRILGEKMFDNPKPVELISFLIKSYHNQNATVLDFFAGSGTTGQAVMELNAEDGGKRRFILVTNNENGIGENITRERLYRVITGKGSKGESFEWTYSKDKPYLSDNSVRVFKLEYEPLTLNDLDKAEKIKEFAKKEFEKINENYDYSNDFNVYNELSALCPYKQED